MYHICRECTYFEIGEKHDNRYCRPDAIKGRCNYPFRKGIPFTRNRCTLDGKSCPYYEEKDESQVTFDGRF